MKRSLISLLLVVMVLSLVSCSATGADTTGGLVAINTTTKPVAGSTKAPDGTEKLVSESPEPTKKPEIKPNDPLIMKLWLMNVGDNIECSTASRYTAWENYDENNNKTMVTLQIEMGANAYQINPPSSAVSMKKSGKEYLVFESLNVGDYRREIYWADNESFYKLEAKSFIEARKATIEIASPETAESLMKNPSAGVTGFALKRDDYGAKYLLTPEGKEGIISIDLSLTSPKQTGRSKKLFLSFGLEEKEEGSLSYLISVNNDGGALAWNTDIGIFYAFIYASSKPNNLVESDFAFINSRLIKTVNDQLGAKPLPFPD